MALAGLITGYVGFVGVILLVISFISIPAYLGMQEKAKRTAIIKAAQASAPDLQHWINAARKAGTVNGNSIEVDSDGNGIVDEADLTNDQLARAGVITTFINTKGAMNQTSPWNPSKKLWANGGIASNEAVCDRVGTANPGQITLCYTPSEDQTIRSAFISARDSLSKTIYLTSIHAE